MNAIAATTPATPTATRPLAYLRDVLALSKPGIVSMTLLTAGWGLALAPASVDARLVAITLLGIALSVGSSNALNMLWERDVDKLMARTRLRPLPDQRLSPRTALVFAIVTGVSSVFVLGFGVNWLTAALSTLALGTYVFVYTPMKRWSPWALPVGAFAGAMPPLLGFTAATGKVALVGVTLFAILFVWQIPHFVAIALFRNDDYARAGIRTIPQVYGEPAARVVLLGSAVALWLASVALAPLGAAGWLYVAIATSLSLVLIRSAWRGLRYDAAVDWPRKAFRATLVILPGLAAGMLLEFALRAA